MSLNVEVVLGADGVTASAAANGPTDLQAQVQGNRAPGADAVTRPGTQIGKLNIVDGLTSGVSVVQVLADLDRLSLAGSLGFNWSLVSAPPGSKAALGGADQAQASLTPDVAGTYDLSLTVGYRPSTANGPTVTTPVTVTARPDDPPIGVPIQTLAKDPAGLIWIDGQPVPNTKYSSGKFVVAVLNRATRELVLSQTLPRDLAGARQLLNIANQYTGSLGYLMIVSVPLGVADMNVRNVLAQVTKNLGHEVTASEERSGQLPRFSIIGVPGGAANSAWMSTLQGTLDQRPDPQQGNIVGDLQVNPATNLYGFVNPEYPAINTVAPGSGGLTNVIQVNGRSYSATLNEPTATGGVHLLFLEPYTLQPIKSFSNNEAWVTNFGQGVAAEQERQSWIISVIKVNALETAANRAPPIVIVQSIGNVKPLITGLGASIAKVGGNAALFNALADNPGGYALIGRGLYATAPANATAAAGAESSTVVGQSGQLTGVFSRTRTWDFAPLISSSPDALGALDTSLMSVAYQAPTPFPAFTGGEAAAETYIGEQLRFCAPGAPSCDVRRAYYERYRSDWHQKALDLARLTYPGDQAFTAAEFNAVKDQLSTEISDLNHVQTYLAALQAPFNKSATRSYVDLQAIGQKILADVGRPEGQTDSRGWQIFGAIVGFSKLYFDVTGGRSLKLFLDGVGAAISLVSALSRTDGAPTIEGVIHARTTELASAILDRFDNAERALTQVGLLIVSDYGKLTAAASRVDSDWAVPSDLGVAADAIRTASQQFFYESLLPIAYPYLLQVSQAPPAGPDNARKVSCWYDGYWKDPFTDQPDSAQDRQIVGFNADGSPIKPVVLIRRGPFTKTGGGPHIVLGHAPDASITDPLFVPASPGSPGIGLNKLQFFSSTYWPNRTTVHVGHFTPFYCGLA